MSARSQARRRRLNPTHPCDVPGCRNNRHGLGLYCANHKARIRRSGHPTAQAIPNASFNPYVRRAFELLHPWISHKATVTAADLIENLLNLRVPGIPPIAVPFLRVVRDSGAGGYAGLARIAGVYLFREENPRAFVSDLHFSRHLAKVFLGLAPRETRVSTGGTRYYRLLPSTVSDWIAQHIQATVGVYFLRFVAFLAEQQQAQSRNTALLATAFTSTPNNNENK